MYAASSDLSRSKDYKTQSLLGSQWNPLTQEISTRADSGPQRTFLVVSIRRHVTGNLIGDTIPQCIGWPYPPSHIAKNDLAPNITGSEAENPCSG